jgi:DNA repair exonuclease SbcCD ATPase subunit
MIRTLTISGFRGISEEIPFSFGAVTLLSGRNGLGKTTVFDAIDWCLFGASWRLGFDPESVRNIYHPNLDPVVRMEMHLEDKTLLIERTVGSAFLDGARISDRDLVETLMIDPGCIAPYTRDVESRLRRVVYLSQEDIRALVHPDSASERVSLYQALLGVPNASVVQSGIRRIRDRFRQREQEMRLHLGQLRSKRDELNASLQDAASETIDTARVISEASQTLSAPSSLTVEELAQRSRQELDKLSVESIQLDEAVSSIAAFRERRKADAEMAERLSQEIQQCTLEEGAASSANDRAIQGLRSVQLTNEERRKTLNSALELQARLHERVLAQRRIDELIAEEEEANRTLRASQEAAELLRADLERLRRSSDVALGRRHAVAVKRSELDAARDRSQTLHDRQREEAEFVLKAQSLTDAIGKQMSVRDSLQSRLQEAREEMNRRREEYESLAKMASSSDALESLLRQAASMLPPDLGQCPLCGNSFGSQQELLLHIARAREHFALTSDALSQAIRVSRSQQQLVDELEVDLRDANRELALMESEKSQCDSNLQRVRDVIATIPAQIEAPAEGVFESLEEELRSIDEELRGLRNDIDDRTTRLGVAQDEVSRASVRRESAAQKLILARQNGQSTLTLTDLEQRMASAVDEVNSSRAAAAEAANAEEAATEDQLAQQIKLQSISRHLADLRSQLASERERIDTETASLLEQLASQVQAALTVDEAAERVQERRTKVSDRLVMMRRLWSELVVAGTEEQSKAIRLQIDAVERELAATQRSLDGLLRAHSRFSNIADELQRTSESEAAGALQHQRQAIQECFTAMYPHRHLNEVVMGDDPLGEILVTDKLLAHGVEPTTYLSTGQANVLALSVFMGIALRQRLLKIGILCLDEPVQHLDDLHFLGFVSLLKRVGLSRQVVMSTADANVAEIITRQMESSWAELSTDFIRYDWHSFDPKAGPSVETLSRAKRAAA